MYMLFILMKKERRQTEDLMRSEETNSVVYGRSVTEPPGSSAHGYSAHGYSAHGGSETQGSSA